MFLMSLMLLQSGKSYASESYAASQSSVCGSYGILRRLAMSDSLGSSVICPSSLAPGSLLLHQTMPVDSAYTVRTQSLVHELREERDQRIMELIGKKKFGMDPLAFLQNVRVRLLKSTGILMTSCRSWHHLTPNILNRWV